MQLKHRHIRSATSELRIVTWCGHDSWAFQRIKSLFKESSLFSNDRISFSVLQKSPAKPGLFSERNVAIQRAGESW